MTLQTILVESGWQFLKTPAEKRNTLDLADNELYTIRLRRVTAGASIFKSRGGLRFVRGKRKK